MKDLEIEGYLKILKDKPIIDIGRASNMLWIGFGESIKVNDYKGNEVTKSSISLHVQSTWRIINKEEREIKVASSDMYAPNSDLEWSDHFDWDVQGNNLFDEKSKNWFDNNIYVRDFKINRWGDLLLLFSNEDSLEIFVDVSNDSECWRLFEYNSNRDHFVVTGQGVFFE